MESQPKKFLHLLSRSVIRIPGLSDRIFKVGFSSPPKENLAFLFRETHLKLMIKKKIISS